MLVSDIVKINDAINLMTNKLNHGKLQVVSDEGGQVYLTMILEFGGTARACGVRELITSLQRKLYIEMQMMIEKVTYIQPGNYKDDLVEVVVYIPIQENISICKLVDFISEHWNRMQAWGGDEYAYESDFTMRIQSKARTLFQTIANGYGLGNQINVGDNALIYNHGNKVRIRFSNLVQGVRWDSEFGLAILDSSTWFTKIQLIDNTLIIDDVEASDAHMDELMSSFEQRRRDIDLKMVIYPLG